MPMTAPITDATALEGALYALLTGYDEELGDKLRDTLLEAATYEGAGILTRDRGLVLGLDNGAEFQLTIIQTRPARGERR